MKMEQGINVQFAEEQNWMPQISHLDTVQSVQEIKSIVRIICLRMNIINEKWEIEYAGKI